MSVIVETGLMSGTSAAHGRVFERSSHTEAVEVTCNCTYDNLINDIHDHIYVTHNCDIFCSNTIHLMQYCTEETLF